MIGATEVEVESVYIPAHIHLVLIQSCVMYGLYFIAKESYRILKEDNIFIKVIINIIYSFCA